MKIIKLTVENIKKLRAVEITPTGSVVQITGPNGSGKSSVLDAIFWALAGTRDLPSQPVRQGEEKAVIRLNLGEVTVIRRFTAGGGTSLVVEAASGARFPSPQAMLDELLGQLAFDPLAFIRMTPAQQLETLRGLIRLDVDLNLLDGQNHKDFDDRAEVNRRVKNLEAQIAGIAVPSDLPAAPIDVAALLARAAQLEADNKDAVRQQASLLNENRECDSKLSYAKQLIEEAEALLQKASELRNRADGITDQVNAKKKELAEITIAAQVDVQPIHREVQEAQSVNRAIEARERKLALGRELAEQKTVAASLTERIEQRLLAKREAIARAPMPLDGLSFGDDEVRYRDLPLTQAGDAEQLRISVAIAMAANPKLRILRIKDGSLLDENGLRLLQEMADTHDYQVWIERVDTSGKVGVVMEDGSVVKKTEE